LLSHISQHPCFFLSALCSQNSLFFPPASVSHNVGLFHFQFYHYDMARPRLRVADGGMVSGPLNLGVPAPFSVKLKHIIIIIIIILSRIFFSLVLLPLSQW
jgi:hypothetical protein